MVYRSADLRKIIFNVIGLVAVSLTIIYILLRFENEYSDPDVLIYTLIGKGIYQYRILPYEFAFDHKPIVTYLIYGLLSYFPFGINIYVLFTVGFLLTTALIIHRFYIDRALPFWLVFLFLVALTRRNVAFSGNTELILAPLELAAVALALRSHDSMSRLVLAAITTVLAFNVNYVIALPLFLALVYALFHSADTIPGALRRLVIFGALCTISMGALLGMMQVAGGDVTAYLAWQKAFLTGYKGMALYPDGIFVGFLSLSFASQALALVPSLRPPPERRSRCIAMALIFAGTLVSFLLSRKFFPHYVFLCAVPTAVVLLSLNLTHRMPRYVVAGLVVVQCVALAEASLRSALNFQGFSNFRAVYEPLSRAVGTQRLMSMHASIVPLYYSGRFPFQPLVWVDHAEIIYGPEGADAYYQDQLSRHPAFVMTLHDWCSGDGSRWAACGILSSKYSKVLSIADKGNAIGYDLYRSNDQIMH